MITRGASVYEASMDAPSSSEHVSPAALAIPTRRHGSSEPSWWTKCPCWWGATMPDMWQALALKARMDG
jgi:hypothetical protein